MVCGHSSKYLEGLSSSNQLQKHQNWKKYELLFVSLSWLTLQLTILYSLYVLFTLEKLGWLSASAIMHIQIPV